MVQEAAASDLSEFATTQVLMFQTSPILTGLTLAVLPLMLIAFQAGHHV